MILWYTGGASLRIDVGLGLTTLVSGMFPGVV